MKNIWVVSENLRDYPALCKRARSIEGAENAQVIALWIGSEEDAQSLQSENVNTVYGVSLGEQDSYASKICTALSALDNNAPDIMLCAASKNTRLLAAQVAAKLGTRVVNDISELLVEDGTLYATHMVYGGSATRKEQLVANPAVLLLSESFLLVEAGAESAENHETAEAELVMLACDQTATVETLSKRARDVEQVDLAGASVVISAGRGIEKEEDLQLIRDLATCLQGEIGCTRPLAEGVRWMSHERYIGVSGVMLRPKVFIAVGLSGQIQHMVGANRANTIIAINKEKSAPIFKQSDYGIVGDLYEVIPQLIKALA